MHLTMFIKAYEKTNGKSVKKLNDILKIANKISEDQRKPLIDPVKII